MAAKKEQPWPRIRKRTRPSGTDYSIDCGTRMGGKRKQYFRKTRDEAEDLASHLRDKIARLGELSALLSPQQTLEAAQCFEKLKGTQTSLSALVEHFLSARHQNHGLKLVKVLRDDLIAELTEAGRRPRTITTINQRLSLFVGTFGEVTINMVTTEDMVDWLGRQDWSAGTKAGVIRTIQQLFNYAMKRGQIQVSAAEGLIIPLSERRMPHFMEVEDVDQILSHAKMCHSYMIPRLAIAFFAGLRSSEIEKLHWGDINFEERIITVRPEVSKIRQARHVPMSDNLVAWLHEYAVHPINPDTFDAHRRKLCEKLGIRWDTNVARHSYASYHLAMNEDAAKTALYMGHRDTSMLFRHYRGLASKAQAQAFWGLKP